MRDPSDPIETGFFRRLADLARRGDPNRRGFGSWLRVRLLVGFLVSFPLVVTLFFGRFLFNLLDRWFRPISEALFGFPLVGVGMILSLLVILALGGIATNVVGGRLLQWFERRIAGVPLLSPIYAGARQITEAIQIRDAAEFRRVVLVRFPNSGFKAVGFVTREFAFKTRFSDRPSALVFVPTTPNPTSGFLVSIDEAEMETLDITIEEGVKMIISGGLLTPGALLRPEPHPAVADPGLESP